MGTAPVRSAAGRDMQLAVAQIAGQKFQRHRRDSQAQQHAQNDPAMPSAAPSPISARCS